MNDGGNGLEGREIEKIWVEAALDLDLFQKKQEGKILATRHELVDMSQCRGALNRLSGAGTWDRY